MKWTLINARSVCNKFTELYQVLYDCDYDIVLITETWLNDKFPNSIIDPHNCYYIFRCDRSAATGGGVCVLVSKRYNAVEVCVPRISTTLEICCVDIDCSGVICRTCLVYRPPKSTNMPEIIDSLRCLIETRGPCIIAGDLNCKDINWAPMEAPIDGVHDLLLDFCVSYGFTQLTNEPTRSSSLLDIVLSNTPLTVCDSRVTCPFSNSDHSQVEFTTFFESPNRGGSPRTASHHHKYYDWKNADFAGISQYLSSVDWAQVLSVNLTPDSLWTAFTEIMQIAIENHVRVVNVQPRADGVQSRSLVIRVISNGCLQESAAYGDSTEQTLMTNRC